MSSQSDANMARSTPLKASLGVVYNSREQQRLNHVRRLATSLRTTPSGLYLYITDAPRWMISKYFPYIWWCRLIVEIAWYSVEREVDRH